MDDNSPPASRSRPARAAAFSALILFALALLAIFRHDADDGNGPGAPPVSSAGKKAGTESGAAQPPEPSSDSFLTEDNRMKPSTPLKPPRPSLAEKLTFFPAPYPAGDWQPEGLDFEDCWFETGDGLRLHGWFVPHDRPCGVLLFAHGNAGNLSGRAEVVRLLNSRLALSVMIFDYRGYGRSEGVPTVEGILRDARAAHDYLVTEKQVPAEEMLLLGRSIGGAVMVDLAAERGARGLILESTFTSLREAAFHHYPRFLVRAAVPDRLNSIERIRDYDGPVFISHGDADRVVPYAHGEELFEAAGEPKRFFPIPGGDHNDTPPDEYYRELERFLESL